MHLYEVNESSFIFLALYIDGILLVTIDMDLLIKTKSMLCNSFNMKDLGDASFILSIKYSLRWANYVLQVSQRAYIYRIMKKFYRHTYFSISVLVAKGDKPIRT